MQYEKARKYAATAISTLCGVLIAMPLALRSGGSISFPLILIGAVIGFIIGKRRGDSPYFLYFVLFLTALLAYTLSADFAQFPANTPSK